MKIAITGATGFVGRHLALALNRLGHEVVLIARGLDERDREIRTLPNSTFYKIGLEETEKLGQAFNGCDAIAHCAGINRERHPGDYQKVHVDGTASVIEAASHASVHKIVLMSFFRARPHCKSGYHESKWRAEELVRNSGLDYTVLKCGMAYGLGDHMLDHLSHVLYTLPVFGTVGFNEKLIYPVAVSDVVAIMVAALTEKKLSRETVAVRGPDAMLLSDAVKIVAGSIHKTAIIFPMPVAFHYTMAAVLEKVMKVPLVSTAQIRMLEEGFSEAYPADLSTPQGELKPQTRFSEQTIRAGLPPAGPFTNKDLLLGCHRASRNFS